MKKLIVIALIMVTGIVFAQRRGMGKGQRNGDGMGVNSESSQNLTIEERHKKRTDRKYAKIKKRLNKENADKLIKILRKYDEKIFKLRKPHMEKMQKLEKAEYANFDVQIKLIEEGLNLKAKILKLKKQEFKELKNSGIDKQILVKVMKKLIRKGHHGMKGKRNAKRGHKRGGCMHGMGNGQGNGRF